MPHSAEIKQDTLGKPKVVPCSRDRLGRGFQNDGLLESCTYGRLISHVTERGLYPDGNGETLKCVHLGSALLTDILLSPDFMTRSGQNPLVALQETLFLSFRRNSNRVWSGNGVVQLRTTFPSLP